MVNALTTGFFGLKKLQVDVGKIGWNKGKTLYKGSDAWYYIVARGKGKTARPNLENRIAAASRETLRAGHSQKKEADGSRNRETLAR